MMAVSAIVFGAALLTILAAHAFEQFGGYAPCPLCLQERYAYYFGVLAAVIAFFAARSETFGFARLVLVLIAIGFLIIWGSDGIVDTPVIRCDEAPWHFLGLSFAGWNAVVSAALALVALFGATRRA
jgi:disulfide bond formation protein DsbB